MNLLIHIRRLGKDRLFALFSFIAGLIFVLGIFLQIIKYPGLSWTYPIEQLGKITCQSNLLALFTSGLYLFRPQHRFFRKNTLLLFTTTLLWFAGIGFWCLLFPLYYIDLGNLIISSNEPKDGSAVFYVIWDHTVTQFLFLFFFQQLNKRKDLSFLVPIETKQIIKCMLCYTVTWVFYNILVSFIFNMFPTYGILTNFNPHTTFSDKDSNSHTMLFNVRFLIISHLFCCFISCVLSWCFSLWAMKLRAINEHAILRKAQSLGYLN